MDGIHEIRIDPGKLRDAREGKGLTQEEAAASVGVGAGQISHIECGRKLPSADVLARLCALYGVDISSITNAKAA